MHVRATPYFPDAPGAESSVVFKWILTKLTDSTGMGRMGAMEGRWMVHDIEADFSGWAVLNPNSYPKTPDAPPKQRANGGYQRYGP